MSTGCPGARLGAGKLHCHALAAARSDQRLREAAARRRWPRHRLEPCRRQALRHAQIVGADAGHRPPQRSGPPSRATSPRRALRRFPDRSLLPPPPACRVSASCVGCSFPSRAAGVALRLPVTACTQPSTTARGKPPPPLRATGRRTRRALGEGRRLCSAKDRQPEQGRWSFHPSLPYGLQP